MTTSFVCAVPVALQMVDVIAPILAWTDGAVLFHHIYVAPIIPFVMNVRSFVNTNVVVSCV